MRDIIVWQALREYAKAKPAITGAIIERMAAVCPRRCAAKQVKCIERKLHVCKYCSMEIITSLDLNKLVSECLNSLQTRCITAGCLNAVDCFK